MTKTILYTIATLAILILIYLGCCTSYNYSEPESESKLDSMPKKDSIVDSLLTRLFQKEEINLEMSFKQMPNKHNHLKEAQLFYDERKKIEKYSSEYRKDNDYLMMLEKSKKNSLLITMSDSLILKWKNKKIASYYYEQVFFAIDQIAKNDFLSQKQKVNKIHSYYKIFREKMPSIDPDGYTKMIADGEYEIAYYQNQQTINSTRKELLIFWLETAEHFQSTIDTNFNFHQAFYTNCAIPQGFVGSDNYNAGISPAYIQEPLLRKAYTDSITKNVWITKKHTQQLVLRDQYSDLMYYLRNNIAILYSIPPANNNELDSLLNEYIINEKYKISIKNSVKEHEEENKK
jgi:hypothetical protein